MGKLAETPLRGATGPDHGLEPPYRSPARTTMSQNSILPITGSLLLLLITLTWIHPEHAHGAAVSEERHQLVTENNRGVGLMGRFDYAAAHSVFSDLSRRYPDMADVQINLAIATLNRQLDGDEQRALDLARAVLESEPDHLRAHYVAGLMLLYLGDTRNAQTHFQAVVDGDPRDAYAAYYLGQVLTQASHYEAALAQYRRAIELDPYLRSAYYGAFQVLRRLKRVQEARSLITDYQRLNNNPRARLAEFKYTRMGPKANALALDVGPPAPPFRSTQPLFAPQEVLPVAEADTVPWGTPPDRRPAGLSGVDINGDGVLDLYAAGALEAPESHNLVLLGRADGTGYTPRMDHPLARVPHVNAAVWGDYDNDGLPDVYLLRNGPNELWQQRAAGTWENVTASTETGNGDYDSVDGALFDADHDGDLDLFVVNADGPNELLNNDLNGRFRPIARERGIAGDKRNPSRQILPTDLDGDRDVDLVIINRVPPHEVYLNDRLWDYRPAPGYSDFAATPALAAIAEDRDADGRNELYTIDLEGVIRAWSPDMEDIWRPFELARIEPFDASWAQLAVADLTGDGSLELVTAFPSGWRAVDASGQSLASSGSTDGIAAGIPFLDHPARGPSILALRSQGGLQRWAPGPGRAPFLSLSLSGREEQGQSMRSNASGIGAAVALRVGDRWSLAQTYRRVSGPGQGLQPLSIGLGGAPQTDFVAIDWTDGVYQSELGLGPGPTHRITETQRQLSSCPVLFTWDGQRFRFVSDVLGVGGLGFATGPGQYATPRPWENFLMPADALAADRGRFRIKITEPMEETAYLDAVRLVAYDLPSGWQMVLDERMGTAEPLPTGRPLYFRDEVLPARAVNERGQDVTTALRHADGRAAPVGPLDRRFIGRLAERHTLELSFPQGIEAGPGEALLVADGWVEYPYSQTMFAAWQADAAYESPTIEYRDRYGVWQTLYAQIGYPAGMPRRMSIPLSGLPSGTRELRIHTTLEIYWDRLAIAATDAEPEVRRTVLPLQSAEVRKSGFPVRVKHPQRRPDFDYMNRAPFWDTRYMEGFYTRLGAATELVAGIDDALAVIGAGDELTLNYTDTLTPLPEGWTRFFVLELNGWAKDMNLYTRSGETVAPLPGRDNPRRRELHDRYNTRYQSGL